MDTRTRIIVAAELAAQGLSMCVITRPTGPPPGDDRIVAESHLNRRTVRISGTTSLSSPASRLEPDAATLVIPLHSISTLRASSPPPPIDVCEAPAYTANEIRPLPGLRGVDVSRIIAGRPYQSRDELLTREIAPQPVRPSKIRLVPIHTTRCRMRLYTSVTKD